MKNPGILPLEDYRTDYITYDSRGGYGKEKGYYPTIYFMKSKKYPELMKVGFTSRAPLIREDELLNDPHYAHYRLELVHSVKCSSLADEYDLHEFLAQKGRWVEKEMFKVSPDEIYKHIIPSKSESEKKNRLKHQEWDLRHQEWDPEWKPKPAQRDNSRGRINSH